MSYYVMFGSSLPRVVCKKEHVLLRYVRFVFTPSCLQEGACLITLCSVRLYPELFVGGSMSYYVMFGSSLPRVVCRREHVLLRYVRFVFTSSCLQEGACLITLCSVRLYPELCVGGSMSYYVMFGSSLPRVVCRREHVLLRYVRFVFTSSCL